MDPHRELGIQRGASEADIKAAYRKLVLQYHPDRHINSSASEAAAAAHGFKVITEAYDVLTNPQGAPHSSYGREPGSTRSTRAYHHYNVNTDWSHSETGGAGYTSRMSRWEWWQRAARHGMRTFGNSLHLNLAVLLLGAGITLEYSHNVLWASRNKGKSFQELQAALRERKYSDASAAGSSSVQGTADEVQQQQQQQQQPEERFEIRSSWADSMRGRFVPVDSTDIPSSFNYPRRATSDAAVPDDSS